MSLSLLTRKTVICWWLAVGSPAVLFGQVFNPQGGEFSPAGALPGDQVYPSVAVNQSGGYLVWQDNAVNTLGLRIRAARLNSGFTTISNFIVSSAAKVKTTGDQEKPNVSLLQDGGAVVVWQGGKQGAQQIYARFLRADGSFVNKTDIRVSTHPKNNQADSQIVTLADDSVVIVWSSDNLDGSMKGVFARQFSATGGALGAEFQVNQFTANNQRTPSMAALANGNFVVAWVSELQRGVSSVDIYARIFDSSGAALNNEFLVDVATNNICANPAVAGASDGGFMVAWSQNANITVPTPVISGANNVNGVLIPPSAIASTTTSSNGWDVFGNVFDGTGAVTTMPFRLNAYTYGDQYGPKISALGTNYMAIWSSLNQPDPQSGLVDHFEGVFGQFITSSGSFASTNDLHVNTTTLGRQIYPTVVSDGSSRFVAVWSSLVTTGIFNIDLFAQQYVQTGGQ